MIKLKALKLILMALFFVFIYFYLKPTNYEKNYLIDEFKILEKYDDGYYFTISNKKYIFENYFNLKYSPKRRLIDKIDVYQDDSVYCIYYKIDKIVTYPLCYNKNQLIDFRLVNNPNFNQYLYEKYNSNIYYINKKINNYTLFRDDNANKAIWNYKGIDFVKNDIIKTINFFKNDIYDSSLLYLANKYLFIPNYSSEHSFNECYIFNLENGDYKLWKMPKSINFESYVLGSENNTIYVVDKKEAIEYSLDLLKHELIEVSNKEGIGKIYLNGWKEITMTKLINNKYSFEKDLRFSVEIKNNNLFVVDNIVKQNKLISKIENPYLVTNNNDNIYYIKEDILYNYNSKDGETKIMSNYEWNFNYFNNIFVYIK